MGARRIGQIGIFKISVPIRPFEDAQDCGDWTITLKAMAQQRKAGPSQRALAALPAHVPEGLRRVLLRCLAPEPNSRPTASELVGDLTMCAEAELQDWL